MNLKWIWNQNTEVGITKRRIAHKRKRDRNLGPKKGVWYQNFYIYLVISSVVYVYIYLIFDTINKNDEVF